MDSKKFTYHEVYSNLEERGLNISDRIKPKRTSSVSGLKSVSEDNIKDNKITNGFYVEDNSFFTHHHSRTENGVFYISCKGNNFIFKTPKLYTFTADLTLGAHTIEGDAGLRFLYGYNKELRNGYVVDFSFNSRSVNVKHGKINKGILSVFEEQNESCSNDLKFFDVSFKNDGNKLYAEIFGLNFEFTTEKNYSTGNIGIAFLTNVGEIAVFESKISSNDNLEYNELCEEKTVVIPLRNGGNIPYTLSYNIVSWNETKYLEYKLDGGTQYREKYPEYPRDTDQYSVEKAFFTNPYIALYRKTDNKELAKHTLYDGKFGVADPGLHWTILRKCFNIKNMPLNGKICLDDNPDISELNIAFGYESFVATGYRLQEEKDIEFIYDFNSASIISEGKAIGIEYIDVKSHSPKTLCMIPDSVYDRDTVISHLEQNHFFDKSEDISFNTKVVTDKDKDYITVKAELLDVYGDFIKKMTHSENEDMFNFSSDPLDIGVYRIKFYAYYGEELFTEKEIVFEVYDSTGKKCAPTESGLPILFSMPNEQRYLDRDAFDLYNPVPDCNMEHYISYSGMTGDIGMKKRIWETNQIFGRKWYVWDSDHRTLTKEEFKEYNEDILKNSDYCYYTTPYEWACVRHDIVDTRTYNGNRLIKNLKEFLKIHPEYNVIGLEDHHTEISSEQLVKLLSVCMKDWTEYALDAIEKTVIEQNKWLKSINPDIKRACYGPFPIYYGSLTTHHGLNYVGSKTEGYLAETLFDGFAQLEDYPYSCSYNTFKGPGFLMHVLLHNPNLTVYPEEYTSSPGGCIDGAVKDAHPPIGKYDMQPYFNVTHSYEYAFNTSYLTAEGFSYWNTYGFMQRDFTEEFTDAFIKGWKNVRNHKPVRPLKSTAFLSEVSLAEDKVITNGNEFWFSNRSNVGLSYMFETSRFSGLPNGFTVSYKSILNLTSEMTDCIVLPSTSFAPDNVITHIRKLYNEGVSLYAIGDVKGFEDIFRVEERKTTAEIFKLRTASGTTENIYPDHAEFLYVPENNNSVALWAEGLDGEDYPAIIKGERTCLVNASIDQLGHRTYENHPLFAATNISPLVRAMTVQSLTEISTPVAKSDGAGLTLFEDEHGNTLMLVIDYSDYDLADTERTWESTVKFNNIKVTDIEPLYGKKPALLKKDGIVQGVFFKLHQQECALYKLIKE